MSRACPPNTVSYTIKAGDTFYSLAKRYNTTLAALISANPTINVNNLQVGQRICIPQQQVYPACPEGNYYTIKSGDNFYAIARRYRVSLDDLLEANPGVDPDRLRPGQVICIPLAIPPVTCPPGSTTYVIQAGDTYYKLAQRFSISVDALIKANPEINPNALLIGEQICIPPKP